MNETPRFLICAREPEDMDVARSLETVVNAVEFLDQFKPLYELIRLRQKLEDVTGGQ